MCIARFISLHKANENLIVLTTTLKKKKKDLQCHCIWKKKLGQILTGQKSIDCTILFRASEYTSWLNITRVSSIFFTLRSESTRICRYWARSCTWMTITTLSVFNFSPNLCKLWMNCSLLTLSISSLICVRLFSWTSPLKKVWLYMSGGMNTSSLASLLCGVNESSFSWPTCTWGLM